MGSWRLGPSSQVLAVHAALLHSGENGQIVYFSGDEHDKGQNEGGAINHTRVFDCVTGAITNPGSPHFDTFCCGHSFLADGKLLVAGGTESFPPDAGGVHHDLHFSGLRDAAVFDPLAATWSPAASMNPEPGHSSGGGRWYPALCTLPGGGVLALSGHPQDEDTRHNNNSPEAFAGSGAGAWHFLSAPDGAHETTDYPRTHLLPNGHVLVQNPVAGRTRAFKPTTGEWFDRAPQVPDGFYNGFSGSSVLLPLTPANHYRPRVLVCGGATAFVLDLGSPSPAWTATAPRTLAGHPLRKNCNATLLPTGKVLVTGGINDPANSPDSAAVHEAELYDPVANSWTTLERSTVTRNYHSVALLMPDGRVWTCGSNKDAQQSFPTPGADNRELRMEFYEPDYFTATRPRIAAAPASVNYGDAFSIDTPDVASVQQVVLLRAGAATHSFDMEQRYVGCSFKRGRRGLQATAPPSNRIAPPGYYMLFLLNEAGAPSVARFIRLGLPAAAGTPVLIQSRFGGRGNFELITGNAGAGLRHLFRNNDQEGLPWRGPNIFGAAAGPVPALSFIQSNFGNNFEVVARAGDRLLFLWRDSSVDFNWSAPAQIVADGNPVTGVTGNPALIQGKFGAKGNFELAIPLQGRGIAAYWRDNDSSGLPWHGPVAFGARAGQIDALSMIQSNFDSPGNLELVARAGDRLLFFWRDSGPALSWHGPFPLVSDGSAAAGVSGNPALIQSRYGSRGNFELAIPRAGGGINFYWRDNDASGLPWHGPSVIPGSGMVFEALTMIQSNYGSPGNLELVGLAAGNLYFFWRDEELNWHGPMEIFPIS